MKHERKLNREILKEIKKKFGKKQAVKKDEIVSTKGYWDSLPENDEGEKIESEFSNPDLLPENAGTWHVELSDKQQEKLDSIREGLDLLTEQERKIVDLCAEGLSLERASRKMGLSKDAGYSALKRAREKILKFHSTRKADLGGI